MTEKPDKHDQKILTLLQTDSRTSIAEISRKIHLSHSSVTERIKRLENSALITGYHAEINHKAFGYQIMAIIKITSQNSEGFISFALAQPEIVDCYSTIGPDSVIIMALATDIAHLQRLITKVSQFGTTSATIVLNTHFTRKTIYAPDA